MHRLRFPLLQLTAFFARLVQAFLYFLELYLPFGRFVPVLFIDDSFIQLHLLGLFMLSGRSLDFRFVR